MQSGWAYDAEAALPHSYPQLRTRSTVDSWVWLGATEGGLGASYSPFANMHVPHWGLEGTTCGQLVDRNGILAPNLVGELL